MSGWKVLSFPMSIKRGFATNILQPYACHPHGWSIWIKSWTKPAGWSWAPLANSLMALRGFDRLSAVTLLSELGDISRFGSPNQLMGYLGLVPCVYSSGAHRRTGGVTQAGNRHARKCWSNRLGAIASGSSDRLHEPEGGRCFRLRSGRGLEGTEKVVWALPEINQGGQNQKVVCGRLRVSW